MARTAGKSICELNEDDSRIAADKIMFDGAAISGCALPQTEMFAKIIAESLLGFINNHGYGEFTLEEILLALNLNAFGQMRTVGGEYLDQIEFSGVCFNVAYVAKILANYKQIRDGLDRYIENKIKGY